MPPSVNPPSLSAKSPAPIVSVTAAVKEAFAQPEVKEAMAKQGNTIDVSTAEYAAKFFPAELTKYAALVKKAGVEVQ